MFARKYGVFFCALGFALILYACGDLGMVLPSQGSYRVSARVTTSKDDYTLDTYSVVNKNSKIQPYFVNSLDDDPDVRGLAVFVQDYSGKRVSRKVYYMLDSDEANVSDEIDASKPADESKPPDITPAETPQETPAGTETPAEKDPDGSAEEVFPGDPPEGETPVPGATETVPAKAETVPAETAPAKAEDTFAKVETAPVKIETAPAEVETAPVKAETASAGTADASANAGTGTGDAPAKAETSSTETTGASASAGTGTGDASAKAEPSSAETADASTNAGTGTGDAPAEAETGTETAVSSAEATGTGDSGAAKDTGTDASGSDTIAPPPIVSPPEEPSEPVIPEDHHIVLVAQLDQDLPMFQITNENIAIGRYNLVFQVLGKGTEVTEGKRTEIGGKWTEVIGGKWTEVTLYRTFKPIYFLGDTTFTMEDIQSFLPMAVTRGKLIPIGINVMLTTEIKADRRLDPYVIWYSGKKILAQGRMSGGADHLFWKTPEKTGFHNVRAEVFPLLPGDPVPGNMIGKIKELSLPVSSNSNGIAQFDRYQSPEDEKFTGWYQLWGTLDDAEAVGIAQRNLVSLYGQAPRWIPFKDMYSLFVGRDDVYTLPGTPFKLEQGEQGTGRMYFHLAALAEGSILSIRFAAPEKPRKPAEQKAAGETAEGTVALDLFLAEGDLILRIASEDASQEESLEMSGDEFITVVVEFVIAPDRFEAELRLENSAENPAKTTGPFSVALAKPISGEGSILLGGGEKPAGYVGETGTMALNELAFLYDRRSVPENEEEFDSVILKSLLLEEEDLGAEQEPVSLSAL
jgi:hypothetical protein